MAITTLDGVIAGLQPQFPMAKSFGASAIPSGSVRTSWYVSGSPAAATANTSGLSGAALTAPVAGQIPFNNPPSGNAYLSNADISSGVINTPRLLVDRLWHNSGINVTSTGAQTINSVTWPARDSNGSTNGEGVYIALEISTTVGAAAPTLSLSYTNSAGTAGRTATSIIATANSTSSGTWFVFALQAGDTGVRSVQSVTISVSWVSGVVHLVAFRPIAFIQSDNRLGMSSVEDAFTLGMPRLYDGTVLQDCLFHTGTTTHNVCGQIGYTFG